MGKQIMLVNVHEDETRIALVENNILVGLHVQQTDRERKVGNIYRGKVVKINPAFQAAFIDYGEPRNGFLSISDVNFQLYPPKEGDRSRPKIQSVLREGQPVMVQIIKEGMSNKGSALTTFISLAGRYMVMSPNSDRSGVSRKIEDPDTRRRLKDVMEALTGGEDLGVIIRTAGIDQPAAELKRDLEALRKEWKAIQGRYDKQKKPDLLYQEPSPIVRVLRDYFTDNVQEVWVDDAEGFQEALGYFKATLPKFQKRLKLYVGDKSLFSAYRIEEQIEALDSSKVPLKSGGSIIIASTEALVAVDVNSGRSNQAQDIEETALRNNVEAAQEVARQLRLRNLGGLIVIDFIDMMQAKNRKTVEKTLADALKDDKARTTLGTISQFGLLELSRQRIDMELSRGLRVQCPSCGGTGQIPTVNSSANNVLRKIRELAATGRYAEIHGEMPLDAANYLLNEKREALRDLELEFEIRLRLEADPDLPAGHPISLHGAKETGEEAEPTARRDLDAPVATTAETPAPTQVDDDSGARRRRRRRRRRRGGAEGGVQEPGTYSAVREELAASGSEPLDDEMEPAGMDTADNGDGPADKVIAADHAYEEPPRAPRAERAERGAVERQPLHEELPAGPVGGNGQGSGLMFKSEHIITDPEALEKMPPRMVRSNPFRAVADSITPNTVVFDSANLASGGGLAVFVPEPDEEEAGPTKDPEDDGGPDKGRRRRPRRGRRSAEPAASAEPNSETQDLEPQEEEQEDAMDAAQNSDHDDQPDILDPADEVDEATGLPGNFGNLKEPPPQLAARAKPRGRPRPGPKQGGGRGKPRSAQSSAAPAGDGGNGAGGQARRGRSRRGRGRGARRPGDGSPAAAS